MATPALSIIIDPDKFPFEAVKDSRGIVVTRSGMVNTMDPVAALSATGMPAIGDPLSAEYPGVIFQGVRLNNLGGAPDGSGTGGWTKATLTWSTPNYGSLQPNTPGDPWTELEEQVQGQLVNFSPSEGPIIDPVWTDYPVNNGDGIQVETGQAVALVHTFEPETRSTYDVARLLDLCTPNSLNLNPITLPRVLGTQIRLAIGPGQARYRSFSMTARNGILEVVHQLVLAQDHLTRWGVKNKEGRNVGEAEAEMYVRKDMGGLW